MISSQKIVNLSVDVGDRQYDLDIPIGFSYLCGDSGTGKSQLIEDLYRNGVKMMCDLPVYFVSVTFEYGNGGFLNYGQVMRKARAKERAVYILDEDVLPFIPGNGLISDVAAIEGAAVLMAGRSDSEAVVHGLYNSFILGNTAGQSIKLKPYFDLSILPDKQQGSMLITEDSKSSAYVFRSIFGSDYITSANGRGNFMRVLKKCKATKATTVGVLDLCGLNKLVDSVRTILEMCQLVKCESFEELVLRSRQLFPGRVIHESTSYNREKDYEQQLDRELHELYGLHYTKGNKAALDLIATGSCVRADGKEIVLQGYTADWNTITIIAKQDMHGLHKLTLE